VKDLFKPELIHLMHGDKQQFIVSGLALFNTSEILTRKQPFKAKVVGIVKW
jgi:hypothetical protein